MTVRFEDPYWSRRDRIAARWRTLRYLAAAMAFVGLATGCGALLGFTIAHAPPAAAGEQAVSP